MTFTYEADPYPLEMTFCVKDFGRCTCITDIGYIQTDATEMTATPFRRIKMVTSDAVHV